MQDDLIERLRKNAAAATRSKFADIMVFAAARLEWLYAENRTLNARIEALKADNARLKRHIKSNTEMWNADYAIAQKLIADNARLMGLVEGFVTNAGVSDDPDTLMIPVSVYEEATATLAKIKENSREPT